VFKRWLERDSIEDAVELIFVDDCSQDGTRQLIDEMLMKYADRNVTQLFHACNTGRGRTVSDGFRLARGSVVGYIDIDLEVPAHYIPIQVRAIKNGADVAKFLAIAATGSPQPLPHVEPITAAMASSSAVGVQLDSHSQHQLRNISNESDAASNDASSRDSLSMGPPHC